MASTQPQHLHNDFSAEGSVSPSTDATAAHHVGFDDSLLFQPPAQDGANPLDAASLAHLGYADLDGYGDADNLDLSTGFMQSAETSGVAQDADFFDQQSEQRPSVSGSASDEQDGPEKRKSSVDAQEETDGKKPRASGTGKKPGRKPLTSEPTSKRKAQNRAAQRAFRERKEKHLKDLETKVEELEKASKTSTQENSLLKAQIVRLQTELKEYRKRLSWIGTNPIGPLGGQLNYRPVAPPYGGQRPAQPSNPDVSFQFPNLWQQYPANNQPASSKNPAIPGILDRNFLNSSSNTISTPGTPNANPAPISTTNAPDGITSYNAPQHNNVTPQISNRPAPS
ncbi:DNA-binding transcription factor yap1, partial [Ascosphaera atra]